MRWVEQNGDLLLHAISARSVPAGRPVVFCFGLQLARTESANLTDQTNVEPSMPMPIVLRSPPSRLRIEPEDSKLLIAATGFCEACGPGGGLRT